MALTGGGSGGGRSERELKALREFFGGGGGGAGGGGRTVYMGETQQTIPRGGQRAMTEAAQAQVQRRKVSIWMTENEADQAFYQLSAKRQRDFLSKGIIGGRLKLGDGIAEAAAEWERLVKLSAKFGRSGKKVSPLDLMMSYVHAAGGGGQSAWRSAGVFEINTVTGERRYVGPGVYLGGGRAQQTQTRVDLTDPDTAKAIATKVFQELMGRDPGAGELGAFGKALHSAEQSNPVVATTTTDYNLDTGQPIEQSTKQSGGLTAEARAYIGEQQAKKKKEYGVFQAVTTYQNALENLIYGAPE